MTPCLHAIGHPIASLAWCCGSWGPGTLWEDALVPACARPSCPWGRHRAVPVHRLEQRWQSQDSHAPSQSLVHPWACRHPSAVPDGSAAAGSADGAVRGSSCARRLYRAMSTSGGCALGPCVPREMGCHGTGAFSLLVLTVLTLLPTFLPGCSFSEFLGRAATANSLFLARVICTRRFCCVPTVGLWGARSPRGPGSPQTPGLAPCWGAVGGARGQSGSAPCCPQVPARRRGDAQPHHGEGPGASGG